MNCDTFYFPKINKKNEIVVYFLGLMNIKRFGTFKTDFWAQKLPICALKIDFKTQSLLKPAREDC